MWKDQTGLPLLKLMNYNLLCRVIAADILCASQSKKSSMAKLLIIMLL